MKQSNVLNLIISALLVLSIGLFTGFSIGFVQAKKTNFGELKQINEINPGISTIKFMEQENGIIYGEIEGKKIRIAYSPEDIYELKEGEAFQIPVNKINLTSYYSSRQIPEGMAYISSKTGKYFYNILDPRSLRITPKNRLYFKTEKEAYEAGFIPPK